MPQKTKLTVALKGAFLKELAENGGIVTHAVETMNISRMALYTERGKDEEFKALWERCVDIGFDLLVDEAKVRAYEGTKEELHYKGELTGDTIRKKSDYLMGLMLKAHRRRFRDRLAVEDESNAAGTVAIVLPDNGRGDGPPATPAKDLDK